ncbi:MAG: hypothetical protein WBL93_13155 [Lutisporaceae bacterium]
MKKYEVKKLGPLSVFKTMMYMMIIPIVMLILIGVIMTIVGFITKVFEIALIGMMMAIGYPILFIVFYGVFGTLMTLIYNGLAGKFGGLEITLDELDKNENTPCNVENEQ